METATLLLSVGGSRDAQIEKYDVTPAEAALLLALHGAQAVEDIVVNGTVERSNAEERDRLFSAYARMTPGEGSRGPARAVPEMEALFPGRAARLPQTYAELELPDVFFKVKAAPIVAEASAKKTRKKADEPATETPAEDPADDVLG